MSPCNFLTTPDGQVIGVVCSQRRHRKGCEVICADGLACRKEADFRCDGPRPGGKTCDRWLCRAHAAHVGSDQDLCPSCAQARRGEPSPPVDRSKMPKRLKRTA